MRSHRRYAALINAELQQKCGEGVVACLCLAGFLAIERIVKLVSYLDFLFSALSL